MKAISSVFLSKLFASIILSFRFSFNLSLFHLAAATMVSSLWQGKQMSKYLSWKLNASPGAGLSSFPDTMSPQPALKLVSQQPCQHNALPELFNQASLYWFIFKCIQQQFLCFLSVSYTVTGFDSPPLPLQILWTYYQAASALWIWSWQYWIDVPGVQPWISIIQLNSLNTRFCQNIDSTLLARSSTRHAPYRTCV